MSKGNLLIVDDEPLLLENLEFTLKHVSEKIYLAKDGKEALSIVSSNTIHCILCDINMPEMNGVELIKKLRHDGNNVPFIFYTGHGSHELMLEAVKYGAFDFLNKPHMDGVEEAVTRGLRRGMGISQKEESVDFMSEYRALIASLENKK